MSAHSAAETFPFVSLQEEFPGVAGVPETVVLVTGILSKAPAVGDCFVTAFGRKRNCFLLKYCFGFRADLEGYSSKENPPAFPALPAQPELSVWGRGARGRVLSLVSVWCVCTDKLVWQCLVMLQPFLSGCVRSPWHWQ